MTDRYNTLEIPVNKLVFNGHNQRHLPVGSFSSEKGSIKYLIKSEKVYAVAKDIVEEGINPLELFAVCKKPAGKYMVIEGNRRLCALKLLSDPELAADEKEKIRYQKLSSNSEWPIPKVVTCVVFPDQKSCSHWVNLKHNSNQPAGPRTWSAAAKAMADRNSPDRLAALLLGYATEVKLVLKKQIEEIKISTLTRFLGSKIVREAIGIAHAKRLLVKRPTKVFNRLARIFLEDAWKNDEVNSRTNKEDREKYAAYLRSKIGQDDEWLKHDKDLTPSSLKQQDDSAQEEPETKPPGVVGALIPSSWKGDDHLGDEHKDKMIKRVIDELRKLQIKKYRHATGCLIRLLVELSATRFLIKQGTPEESRDLLSIKWVYKEAYNKLRKMPKCRNIAIALDKAYRHEKSDILSPTFQAYIQNAWVHGKVIPSESELRETWDNIDPILEKLLLHGKKTG